MALNEAASDKEVLIGATEWSEMASVSQSQPGKQLNVNDATGQRQKHGTVKKNNSVSSQDPTTAKA